MKVSVIVPCYNVEEYIHDCLDSILLQSFGDFEIVCINDGSTDRTLDILREYSKKDNRVTILNQANCGLSVTRNKGMEIARGEWILFVDSDDKLRPETLAELVDMADGHSLDHITFKAEPFPHDEETAKKHASQIEAFRRFYDIPGYTEFSVPQSGAQLMIKMQEAAHFVMSAPLRFMKLSMLRDSNIKFKPSIIHEDCIFSVDAMIASKRAVFINKCYYLRRVRGGSIMTASGQNLKHLVGYICTLASHMETLLSKSPDYITERALERFLVPISLNIGRVELSKNEEKILLSEVSKHVSPAMMPLMRCCLLPLIGAMQNKNRCLVEKSQDKENLQKAVCDAQKNVELVKRELCRTKKEVADLKNSEAYRIGMFVTWPARKALGGIKCLRDNGLWYTMKHFIGKVLRRLGIKIGW